MEEFLLCNFIEITLLHGWSPVNLLHFCRAPFLNNTYGGLPLYIYTITRNTQFLISCPSPFIIHQFHSYTKILTLIPFIPTPVPRTPTLIPIIPTLIPHISILVPRIPTLIPIISLWFPAFPSFPSWFPYFLHSSPDFTHFRHSLHSIPWFPIPTFTDSCLFIMTARIFIIVCASHITINNFKENRSLVKIVLNYLLKLYKIIC